MYKVHYYSCDFEGRLKWSICHRYFQHVHEATDVEKVTCKWCVRKLAQIVELSHETPIGIISDRLKELNQI